MFSKMIRAFSNDAPKRQVKRYKKTLKQINALEESFEQLTDIELQQKTNEFRKRLIRGESIDNLKAEAFAVVRETSKRVLGLRHYDVQLLGGLALVDGNIAEMATGEGKTLVASLASYLRALEGKGVHVITVNDYLAKRDFALLGPLHRFLGLSVGLNQTGISIAEKQHAYECDITYGVGNEFGFDYLRDYMVYQPKQRVQRPPYFCIIDEIDSVLIDEAKTPLIVANSSTVGSNLHYICAEMMKRLREDDDYVVDIESKAVHFTDEGVEKIENAFDIDNLFDLKHQTLQHYMLQALKAHATLHRDVDYIIQNGKIQLVDLFTGRVMEGRTYTEGLHQAMEAKEGLPITAENKTQATITIQNYFRMYPVISGMTGTAKLEEREFQSVYQMEVIQIPKNQPSIRIDNPDVVYRTQEEKYNAVLKKVITLHKKKQPVLIGTSSIQQSEQLATLLTEKQLSFNLLNAKNAEKEAELIAKAGQMGQITIATNMAGRGTDIILGRGVPELGGLFVIGTERHASRRIDQQLKGRAARQGDPGETQFFISLEDELFTRYAAEKLEKIQSMVHTDETGRILDKHIHTFIDEVQKISEGHHFMVREYNLTLDDQINDQRKVIYHLRNRILQTEDLADELIPLIEQIIWKKIETVCPKTSLKDEWDLHHVQTLFHSFIHPPLDMMFFEDVEDVDQLKDKLSPLVEDYTMKVTFYCRARSIMKPLKQSTLETIDRYWLMHLETMSRFKEGLGLLSYAQEDPIRAYQQEGFKLFNQMYEQLLYDLAMHTQTIVKDYEERSGENVTFY